MTRKVAITKLLLGMLLKAMLTTYYTIWNDKLTFSTFRTTCHEKLINTTYRGTWYENLSVSYTKFSWQLRTHYNCFKDQHNQQMDYLMENIIKWLSWVWPSQKQTKPKINEQ